MAVLMRIDLEQLRFWAVHTGPWFIAVFTLLYAVLTLFPLPRTLWTVAAGILFGPWVGLAVALVALTVSAIVAFSAVRGLFRVWVAARLQSRGLENFDDYLRRRGWVAIASLRMVGPVPFSLVNYAAALTPISLGQFAVATTVGSIPTTAVGVFFGDALTGTASPWVIGFLVLLSVVAVAALVLDVRRERARGGQKARPYSD